VTRRGALVARPTASAERRVRNFEQKGISRSVAIKLTGHKTESEYRRYAIVSESDLAEAARRLDSGAGSTVGALDHHRRRERGPHRRGDVAALAGGVPASEAAVSVTGVTGTGWADNADSAPHMMGDRCTPILP